jgi:tRNA 2-selenouridine synthase
MKTQADYLSIILNDTPLMDVRAPVEHHKGSINNAINLPLMSDKERELVGTCYKDQGQDSAIALGRELVTPQLQEARTQAWLDFSKNYPNGALYCFRGGLRSKISQQWMAENGVAFPFIEGGYKAIRRFLIDELETSLECVPMMLISGKTGCGKTRLLHQLPHMIDLEHLANHKGSSFGAAIDQQPSPINFENSISSALLKHRHQHKNTVFLEDEGRLIGSLSLPLSLKTKMNTLSHIELDTPIEQRIDFAIEDYILTLLNDYKQHNNPDAALDLLAQRHILSLSKIRKRLGPERYTVACNLLNNAISSHRNQNDITGYRQFIYLILTQYYDPMYEYQLTKKARKSVFSGTSQQIIEYVNHQL